jgi:magnesium-transporting ATPase (P-type)
MTNAARFFGIEFTERNSENMIIVNDKNIGIVYKYELLNVIEFTSTRKRMSVIVKDQNNKIICMTKGADSIIIPRLRNEQH